MRRTGAAAWLLASLLAACGVGQAHDEAALATAIARAPLASASVRAEPGGPELVAGANRLQRPSEPPMVAELRLELVADYCTDRDLAAPPADDEVLTILDRSYALSASSVPPDLVPAGQAGFTGASATKLVRDRLINDLSAMLAASRTAGLQLSIESGYRSWANQAATFDSWAARIGDAAARLRTARPGHSEHQLGTAIDVTSPGWGGRFGDWGRETAEGAWLAEHAWEFGFVMSYPAGSQGTTCFGYEPWHYRWIGRAAAAEHRASGLTLRQFLAGSVDE